MIRRVLHSVVCLMVVASAVWAAAAPTQDQVTARKRGSQDETDIRKGRIMSDELRGMKLLIEGAEIAVSRKAVVEFIYAKAHMKAYRAGMDALENEDYPRAIEMFNVCGQASKSRLPENQRKLFLQHVYYHKALAYFRKGEYGKAQKGFIYILSDIPKTAYLFETCYYEARSTELSSPATALSKYQRYAKQLRAELKNGPPWGLRYAALCKVGALRLELRSLLKSSGQESKVKAKHKELTAFRDNKAVWAALSSSDKAELIGLETKIMAYLKEYAQLSALLNAAIRNAQKDNDRQSLKIMYMRRANAHWMMLEKAAPAEKTTLHEKIRFDYLRADLSYPLAAADSTTANYRVAKCFVALKDADWKKRALYHLNKAKLGKRGPDAMKVEPFLTEVKAMEGPAAKMEEAPKKGGAEKADKKKSSKKSDKKKP